MDELTVEEVWEAAAGHGFVQQFKGGCWSWWRDGECVSPAYADKMGLVAWMRRWLTDGG
jgi:hypothetical protein